MKFNRTHLTIAAASALGLTLIAGAASRASAAGFRPLAGITATRGGPLQLLGSLASTLDLSDSQKQEIRGIFQAHKTRLVSLGLAEKDTRMTLVSAIRQPAVDANAVRRASAAVARIDSDLAVERAAIYSEVHAVLTPGQRSTLTAALDDLHEQVSSRIEAFLTHTANWI
ncbi:MAG: Spy/CpxP family protein refolding chaperone [Thermoanaerobaculia bacterium]